MRWAGVKPVQAVDNVHPVFEGLKRADRFRQFHASQGAAAFQSFRNTGRWIEALVLHKEDDAFGR